MRVLLLLLLTAAEPVLAQASPPTPAWVYTLSFGLAAIVVAAAVHWYHHHEILKNTWTSLKQHPAFSSKAPPEDPEADKKKGAAAVTV